MYSVYVPARYEKILRRVLSGVPGYIKFVQDRTVMVQNLLFMNILCTRNIKNKIVLYMGRYGIDYVVNKI